MRKFLVLGAASAMFAITACSDKGADTDGDGVCDEADKCPNTPAGDSVFLAFSAAASSFSLPTARPQHHYHVSQSVGATSLLRARCRSVLPAVGLACGAPPSASRTSAPASTWR